MMKASSELYSGPIPHPKILKEYDDLVPGAAERILKWAEQQTKHRMALEKFVVESDIKRSYCGLLVGGIVAMTCILGGVFLVYNGHDVAGTTIATGTVAGLVGVFIYGTSSRSREREEKAKIMTGQKSEPTPLGESDSDSRPTSLQ